MDINLRDNYGWAPLHYAAREGRIENVERMITEGVNINIRSIMGQSPLNAADEMKQDKVRALLIENGAEDKPIQFPVLEGDYMGQKPPGDTPELFALGIVSSIWGLHSTAAFSPDGNIVLWAPMITIPGQLYSTGGILMSERKKGRWTAPRFAPFTGDEEGDVPFFSPDGKRVYFMSAMPLPGDPQSRKERIWFVDQDEQNVRYWVSEGKLYRYRGTADGSYSNGTLLASSTSHLSFAYYDEDGQVTADAGAVRQVAAELHVERAGHLARLASAVRLRNK